MTNGHLISQSRSSIGATIGRLSAFFLIAVFASWGTFAASLEDLGAVRKKLVAGDYIAAEAECDRLLAEGFSGFFSGTATLSAHLDRGRARLGRNNPDGAIADADKVIQANSTLLPPDWTYPLRALARLAKGDREGALLDYQAAIDAARSGLGSGGRTALALTQRGFGKVLLGDLSGALADIDAGLSTEGGILMPGVAHLKESWKTVRSAVETMRDARPEAAHALLLKARNQLEASEKSAGILDQQWEMQVLDQILVRIKETINAKLEARSLEVQGKAQDALARDDRHAALLLYVQAYRDAASTSARDDAVKGLALILPGLPAMPELSEEVRRQFAQGKVYFEAKDYRRSIEAYQQALNAAPWYAAGHHDMALIYSYAEHYGSAITVMKRYLALAPKASNARQAQDWIYEWEAKLNLAKDRALAEAKARPGGISATSAGSTDCFIATAAWGSYLHPRVVALRDFRDRYLLPHPAGRWLVTHYYHYSQPVAEFIRKHDAMRTGARWMLTPLVFAVEFPYVALGLLLFAPLLGWGCYMACPKSREKRHGSAR